jgi:hypothetical protein
MPLGEQFLLKCSCTSKKKSQIAMAMTMTMTIMPLITLIWPVVRSEAYDDIIWNAYGSGRSRSLGDRAKKVATGRCTGFANAELTHLGKVERAYERSA